MGVPPCPPARSSWLLAIEVSAIRGNTGRRSANGNGNAGHWALTAYWRPWVAPRGSACLVFRRGNSGVGGQGACWYYLL
jgi:hypothetical protein